MKGSARLEARRSRPAKPRAVGTTNATAPTPLGEPSKERTSSVSHTKPERHAGFREEEIRIALDKCMAEAQEHKSPEEEQKEHAFRRRLEKAGY